MAQEESGYSERLAGRRVTTMGGGGGMAAVNKALGL